MRKPLLFGSIALGGWVAYRAIRDRAARLTGSVVCITGGSRGLGLALAEELAREGCKLVLCARDAEELAAARDRLEPLGTEVHTVVCDVAQRDQVDAMVAEAEARFGKIDVLVNNAAILQAGPIEAMTLKDFENAMAVSFWGSVYATLAVLPAMRARKGGRIVNITSIGGRVAIPHLLPYDCAKFAVLGFSEGIRSELAKDGITVTTIVPGLMRTGSPLNASFKGDHANEFAWFTALDSNPITAMSAQRAARRIVLAAKRGEAEVTLGWQAKVLRAAHDFFPGTTMDLLGLVNRMLPRATTATGMAEVRGKEAAKAAPSWIVALTSKTAREYHQYKGLVSSKLVS